MNYDTGLLIDIIESIEGIKHVGDDSKLGIAAKKYRGLTGNLVIIDVSDEDMDDETAKGHLTALGLPNLIQALFPEKSSEPEEDDDDDDNQKQE